MELKAALEEIDFFCNVCGAANRIPTRLFHRELAACASCSANARFRGIVAVLGRRLLQRTDPLCQWPKHSEIRGIGMSDAETYAKPLADVFSYTNTFFHKPPHLDITADELPYRDLDFVISSDVFEHVSPPTMRAFCGLRRMLRPGGLLVFSAPYIRAPSTIEHYPDLHTWRVFDFDGAHVLVNRSAAGLLSVRENLVFHGGPGTTLELRMFGRGALLSELRASGFTRIVEHSKPFLGVGYYWPVEKRGPGRPPLLGYILSAQAA